MRTAARLLFPGLVAALLAAAPPAPAGATIVADPPHDPREACAAILHLVDNLNAGRVRDPEEPYGPSFFTDALGQVEAREEAAFLAAMRNSEGEADARPIRLDRAYRIHADRDGGLYLVVLERQAWHEIRLDEDAAGEVVEVRDPRHYRDTSYWLASFTSNELGVFREAFELYPLAIEAKRLARCASD